MAPETMHDTTESIRIEGTDKLLMQTIKDQATDLEHAWRELIQNAIDALGSTRVHLHWDHDRTIVTDNGEGVDLTEDRGEDLLTNLGETSKEDDDSTIGRFGVGLGQAFAMGRTIVISGDQALLFDIKEWGLDVIKTTVDNAADVARDVCEEWADTVDETIEEQPINTGVTVALSHYEDEVPKYSYKWGRFEERIEERFQYSELANATKIYVNEDRISDSDVVISDTDYSHAEELRLDDGSIAHIGVGVGQISDLDVYSGGVFVTDVDNRGIYGDVVVEGNLDLNFARNEIQSGCGKWAQISERLSEIREDLFTSVPDDRLNQQAREFLVDQMIQHGNVEDYENTEMFRTAGEDYVSLNEIKSREMVGTSKPGDAASDKLQEGLGMIILDESDEATETFIDAVWEDEPDKIPENQSEEMDNVRQSVPDTVDATEKAESLGMHTSHDRLDISELSPTQRKKLMIARALSDKLGDREVYYGESDVRKAWTDAASYIVITDSSTTSNAWIEYVPELFRQLVHEYAHTIDTKENKPSHGIEFNRQYREMGDDNWDALTETLTEIREQGLDEFVADCPKY